MGIERRARGSAPARYRPRRPSESVLYRCVQEHLETWLAQCRDGHDDEWSVPEDVEREFRRYLDCGILAHGFARARCGQYGHDFLIAFSCKGRGLCPSCNAVRRILSFDKQALAAAKTTLNQVSLPNRAQLQATEDAFFTTFGWP